MARTVHGMRTVVRLDSRIALEAILLNRYERVPKTRREEWLRRLLVQGFLSECRAVQGVQERPQHRQKAFGDWLVQESNTRASAPGTAITAPTSPPPCRPPGPAQVSDAGGAGKFAALRAVIGGAG
ncbi:MAG: hypothetical protein OXK72_08530 [Gammaproteobacteria bacterium]|nr:hypothetical protein [Gammaproteobacteria bacterium]